MSAYDNPTIIKNDSALIWAESMNKFGENFNKSFEASQNRRYLEEKEARLIEEKNAKEAKEQTLNNQVFLSKSRYDDQARVEKVGAGLVKVGADISGVDLYNKFVINTGAVDGENNLSIATVVQDKEALDKKAAYSSQRATGEQNLTTAMGGMFSQADAIKSGKINDTNIKSIRFNGDNLLTQAINRSTTLGNAYFDPTKTTRDLVYDANGDPSKITLLINNKIGTKEDVFKFFEATNPGVKDPAFLESEFQKGLQNEDIIESVQDGVKKYEFKFKKEIDKNWDGTLYSEVPEIEYGKSPILAGVYSKEGDNKISSNFIGGLTYEKIAGNAKLNKNQGTVMYERQEVFMDNIISAMKPTMVAQAQGLIASYLSNNNVADGVLAQLDYGTNYPSKAFADLTTNQKVAALVERMEKKEKQNIIEKSDLKTIKDAKGIERYYIMDEKNNQIFSNATTKTSGGGQTDFDKKETIIANKTKEIVKKINDSSYKLPIDSPDGNRRIVYIDGVGWVAKNKSGGNWIKDKDYISLTDKKELAKQFLEITVE